MRKEFNVTGFCFVEPQSIEWNEKWIFEIIA